MNQLLRILVVEDSEDDAALMLITLRQGGFEVLSAVVDNEVTMRAELERQDWDVITSDHAMPQFSAPESLALAKELRPDVPFIIVSGEIDLNLAVSLMKEGAYDYVQKRDLVRLVPTIEHLLHEVEIRRERQLAQDALEISETRYRRLFETAQDGILILNADTGQIIDVNPFLMTMLGYKKEMFLGKKLWELGAFKDIETSRLAYLELQNKGYIRYDNLPFVAQDGRQVAVEFVSNIYLVDQTKIAQCNIRDISMREESVRDNLTGLFNRQYMEETLERELLRASRKPLFLSLIMLEVDDFKRINDTCGHSVGNTILHELGSFLLKQTRGADIACRYGDHKFIVVLSEAAREVTIERAERLSKNARNLVIQYEGKTIEGVTLSFGIAVFPHDGCTAATIIKAANDALYHARSEESAMVGVANEESYSYDVQPDSGKTTETMSGRAGHTSQAGCPG